MSRFLSQRVNFLKQRQNINKAEVIIELAFEMETTSRTLYVNNLNEKIKKDVLKKMLYLTFSQYGKIDQIVACKGSKLRGQAWVVFQESNAAVSALRGKQGFTFYDKPVKIAFAKEKSNLVAKQDGTFVARAKRSREEEENSESRKELRSEV